MRRLNVKLVVILAASTVITIFLVAGVHAWQMTRTARVLLTEGKKAEDDEDLEKAVGFYQQYVAYRPDDEEEGAHMALLMADIAEQPGAARGRIWDAYQALETQLRKHLSRDDVRTRLVDYTMTIGRFGDAVEHIQTLLKTEPDNVDLMTKLGRCYVALDRNREALDQLSKSLEKDAKQVEPYWLLAMVLRERLDKPEQADELIDKMVEANPEDVSARLQRVRYVMQHFQKREGVDVSQREAQRNEDLKKALELAPDDADALLFAAQNAIYEQKPEEARRHLEHGKQKHPDDVRLAQTLINLDLRENKIDAVQSQLRDGPKNPELQYLDFQIKRQQKDLAGARKVLTQMESDPEVTQPLKDYLQACLDFDDGKWMPVSKELERLRPALPPFINLLPVDLMLGQCYEQLREYDRAVQAYEVGARTNSLLAHVHLALALMKVGQNDRALGELQAIKLRQGVDQFVQSTPARNSLLMLLLQRNARLPASERDWKDVDELVAATTKIFPEGSKEVLLLEANVREQKGERDSAREMLAEALKKDPTDYTGWLSQARLEFLEHDAAAALAVLDKAQESTGDIFPIRQARIVYGVQLPEEQAKEILKAAAMNLEKFTDDEQHRLSSMVGLAYFRLNDMPDARAIWTKVVQKRPNDPDAQFTLFDISVREEDEAAIDRSVETIKRLFGQGSPEAKFVEARRLVTQVRAKRSGDPSVTLAEARQLLVRAAEQRPRWAVLARFEGEVNILDSRPDDAIESLRRAIELGDTDVATTRQIAQLLVMRGRGEEARQYVQMANSASKESEAADSELLEINIALSEADIPRAVKLLETALKRNPEDVPKTLTLCKLLPQMAREEDAEQLLRDLIANKPEVPDAWLDLVRLLKKQDRIKDGKAVVEEAKAKVPKEHADLTLGQCYEVLGDIGAAEQHFAQARTSNPDDLGMTRALINFYARVKSADRAREELQKLAETKPKNDTDKEHIAWANRELAILIAQSGTYSDFQAAVSRLKSAPGKRMALADKVAMARLLSNRPEAESRIQATKILEDIKNEANLPTDAQLILARLYEVTGNWPKCRDEMLTLLGRDKDNPTYLGTFIEMLLRNDDLEAATFWLDKLEVMAPDHNLTGALRARVLVKQGKPDEAVSLLRNLLPRPLPRERLGNLAEVAKLLEQLDQERAAESMFREYVALDPRQILVLAGFVARHGSLKDALDLCQTGLETRTVEEVVREALTSIRLHMHDATKEDFGRVEGWATKAIAHRPKDMILQLEYAELLDLQGRYAELEENYKRLLKNPDVEGVQRALVLNNLAYLLAVQNKKGECRELVNEAVQILGPQSDLLDTRALVKLAHGEFQGAVDDLSMAVVDQPTGTKYFHLARACQLNRDTQGALSALKKAVETYSLKVNDLPRLEQNNFKQLSEQLDVK